MQDFRSSFTNNAGSRNSATTGSTHPGGAAAGSQPGGASTGSQPGGASTGPHPGGAAAGSQPGGDTGCQTATWSRVNENNGDSTDGHPRHLTEEAQDQHYKLTGGLFSQTGFPDDSTKEDLILRKENSGKIQQLFSEVHRVGKLLKLGQSVCKVVVEYARDVQKFYEGTGFVLAGNFILTNAHLFNGCIEGQQLKEGVKVFALFNYDDPEPHTNYHYFQLAPHYISHGQGELDYAILELSPEGHKPNDTTQKIFDVPPGLLNKFGPMPLKGEACIIGHPAGEVKMMDPTFIIEKENREQAVKDNLHQYNDKPLTLDSIIHLLKQQGIENIMMGGNRADKVLTYNTFMKHGSSGSPVFDANGQVVGLHTGGYGYGFPKHEVSVIEYAQPLLPIFEHLVRTLKQRGNQKLLMRIKEEAKGNENLEKVLLSVERKRKASSSEESGPKAKYPQTK